MERITERHFETRKALSHWRLLFEEWCLNVERYCRITNNDAPYWYNEQAILSIMAGAAWRCGWVALQEFSMAKLKGGKGRADLWILSSFGTEELIEAKFAKTSVVAHNLADTAEQYLVIAREQVLNTNETGDKIAMAMFAPYVSRSHQKNLESNLLRFVDQLQSVKHDALAWSFPEATRSLNAGDGYVMPGIVIIARVV
jgi:hypothetical protein